MHVCATLGSTCMRLREKCTMQNIKRKKPHSRYISRMHGGAFIQPIAMEVIDVE
jgi:hypothetical protein